MPAKVEVKRGYLDEGMLKRFLSHSRDNRERLLWMLMSDAGLRNAEARAVRPTDLGIYTMIVKGKGERIREVSTTERLRVLAKLVKQEYNLNETDVFWPVGSRTVQQRFKRCLKRAGIFRDGLCPHSLRHTFATRCLLAGIDIYRLSVLMGHKSAFTTTGYLHTNPAALKDAAAALDKLNKAVEENEEA